MAMNATATLPHPPKLRRALSAEHYRRAKGDIHALEKKYLEDQPYRAVRKLWPPEEYHPSTMTNNQHDALHLETALNRSSGRCHTPSGTVGGCTRCRYLNRPWWLAHADQCHKDATGGYEIAAIQSCPCRCAWCGEAKVILFALQN